MAKKAATKRAEEETAAARRARWRTATRRGPTRSRLRRCPRQPSRSKTGRTRPAARTRSGPSCVCFCFSLAGTRPDSRQRDITHCRSVSERQGGEHGEERADGRQGRDTRGQGARGSQAYSGRGEEVGGIGAHAGSQQEEVDRPAARAGAGQCLESCASILVVRWQGPAPVKDPAGTNVAVQATGETLGRSGRHLRPRFTGLSAQEVSRASRHTPP
jgi:hypothetical protein